MRPILSLRDLSARLGVRIDKLRQIADNIKVHYHERPLIDPNNKDKVRVLRVPSRELMEVQRRIKNNVLSGFPLSEAVHGGVKKRSPRTNAAEHLGKRCVINLDVRQFFPRVRHYMVHRMFRGELGFGRDVSSLLTKLTTLNSELPQGAPTSTPIANLLLARHVDQPLAMQAKRLGSSYTRFVDDIALSGNDPRPLINVAGRLLSRKRLPMYRKKAKWESKTKLRITSSSQVQEITGLVVNSRNAVSVARKRRDNIRAEIFSLAKTTDAGSRRAAADSIRGKISYVRAFNPGAANRLQRYLEATVRGNAA